MELLTTNKITDIQRKRIFALSRQAALSSQELHSYLPDWCGGSSLSSEHGISSAQANQVIDALTSIIEKKGLNKNKPSSKQLRAIKTMKSILGWDTFRLERFIYHTCGKASLESVTIKEASAVILGLNKVLSFLKKKSVKNQNQTS